MALKGDRTETIQDISCFMNETATRGGLAFLSTATSGIGLDGSAQLVTYTYASGKAPLGILMNDMVNVDQTKYHINQYKDEVQRGGKVRILRDGWVVTNMIYPGHTPTAGALAYASNSGYIATSLVHPEARNFAIGTFDTTKDEDGYARVYVKLPNIG